MPDAIAMVSLALVPVLVVAVWLVGRRTVVVDDPDRWRQEPTEPWGTIAVATFLCSPVAMGAWWVTGSALLGCLVLALVALVLGRRTGAISGIREIAVTDSAVWVRTLRHEERIPLAHVLGVRRRAEGCEIVVASGRAIPLPDGPAGERLGTTIGLRARRWRRAVVHA